MIWLFPRQIKLTFGRRSRRLHHDPACGGRGSERRDHSQKRLFKPCLAAVRPPGVYYRRAEEVTLDEVERIFA